GDDLAVLEGARLGLVGVRDEVDRLRALLWLREEARLSSPRGPRATESPPIRREELVEHLRALHLQRLPEGLVAADLLVLAEPGEVATFRVREEELRQRLLTRSHCGAPRRWRARPRA